MVVMQDDWCFKSLLIILIFKFLSLQPKELFVLKAGNNFISRTFYLTFLLNCFDSLHNV